MQRENPSTKFGLGSKLPNFSLPATDDRTINQSYFAGAQAALVVFFCNHCPYVKGSETMLFATIRKFAPQGLRTVLISSNDAIQYPDDGFEKMKEKSFSSNLPCPYLYDESQDVAKLFDAQCTPECYLFNKDLTLAFHGTINDNPKERDKAAVNFIDVAIGQLMTGTAPNPNYVHPVGCSIKWKR